MKILWLCNIQFKQGGSIDTGSWLQPLAEALDKMENIEIINIAIGDVREAVKESKNNVQQWLIPGKGVSWYGQTASKITCETVSNIIAKENPDLVHIWGTESIWASIYAGGYIKIKTVLDIQGLIYAYTDYYYGGLTIKEIFKSTYIKELLMPWRTLFNKKNIFRKRGIAEKKYLKKFKYISYQSTWVKNQVLIVNPNAKFYSTKIILRDAFYNYPKWEYKPAGINPVIFTSCSAAVTYKGLHVLLRAIAILKTKYPLVTLRIAGNIHVGDKLIDGYSHYLNSLVVDLNLKANVKLTGSLDEIAIAEELYNANVCVVPSFIETYCLAFAEAMLIGVPTVASFAGAMPELANHNEDALFYNSMDYVSCAYCIEELIQNQLKAETISHNARQKRLKENDKTSVIETQISIYKNILQNDNSVI